VTPEVRTLTDRDRAQTPSAATAGLLDAPLARGTTLGRYVVLEPLGEGGMGVVYAAWDFALERRVALKLLRTRAIVAVRDIPAPLREAQAMARVTHPGINAIYDVGTFDGHPFLAMELADGGNLARWLREAIRPHRQILARMLEAGHGLAAAHAAGIAHGDFKPHNVLLTKNGSARVTDFGLASEGTAPHGGPASEAGTPPYMAPERLEGAGVSALSDQFSFAVALYEALCGRRPFEGASTAEVRASIARGPPSTESLRPRWLRSAVLRALSPLPADRFESMDALLHALEPGRRRVRRNAVLGVAFAALLLVAGDMRGRTRERCEGADEALAQIWNPARQARLPSGVGPELTAWAGRWKGTFVSACEATHLRQTQSAPVLDLRMRCLTAQLREVDALLTVLELPAHANQAISAAQGLRAYGACEDGPHLRRWRPHDAEREGPGALQPQLATLRSLHATGQYRQVSLEGGKLAAAARAAGDDYVLAEAQQLRGEAQWRSGGAKTDAVPALQEAVLAAERTGDERVGALAHVGLSAVYSTDQQPLPAESSLAHARALLARMGGDPRLELKVRIEEGFGFVGADDAKAVAIFEDALAFAKRTLPEDDLELTRVYSSLGTAYLHAGKQVLAVPPLEAALARTSRMLGPSHPSLVAALGPLSTALLDLGREEEALQMARRAKQIALASAAPENFQVSYVTIGLGNALMVNGQFAEARAQFESAAALDGNASITSANAWLSIGETLRAEGRPLDALIVYRRAAEFFAREAADHPYRVAVMIGVAEAQLESGQLKPALAQAQQALAGCEKIACGPLRAVALTTLGTAQLHTGAVALARRSLEEAVRLSISEEASAVDLARARFALARVLLTLEERSAAIALAEAAVAPLKQRKDAVLTWRQLQSFLAGAR
jgi:tetratricopeptide (TPR) repeat protein/predicted Ser/Thr protein kinase